MMLVITVRVRLTVVADCGLSARLDGAGCFIYSALHVVYMFISPFYQGGNRSLK